MYASDFNYLRAGTLDDAVGLLQQHPGAKLLAGGHSLIPLLKLRLATPTVLIDIGGVAGLSGVTRERGTIKIGALTTHAALAASPVLREHAPALAEAAGLVGDPAVRNRGTIGGNIAHADPASDLPTVLTALGAQIVITGPSGRRTVAADGFFKGVMTTDLGDQDIVTGVDVPAQSQGQTSAYVKFAHPASRYAVIGVAASLGMAGGSCTSASVALGGLVPKPVRSGRVERALVGQVLAPDVVFNAAHEVGPDLGDDVLGDLYASAEYRRAVASVYVARAVQAAAARAR